MPITFSRMRQFQEQGKHFQGIASGSAAATVMSAGVRDVLKTTGTVIPKEPPPPPTGSLLHSPQAGIAMRVLNSGAD